MEYCLPMNIQIIRQRENRIDIRPFFFRQGDIPIYAMENVVVNPIKERFHIYLLMKKSITPDFAPPLEIKLPLEILSHSR